MIHTNINSVEFNFSEKDKKLFDEEQKRNWQNIQNYYKKLKSRCLPTIDIPVSISRKKWVITRSNLHITTSLMRLLYLVEGFSEVTKNFNSVASAVFVKSMVEIPLHLGYLVWILAEHDDFESIRTELSKIAFGNRDKKTGLTTSSRVSQKDLYTRSDSMIKKIFKEQPSTIDIFEYLYKQANSIGHHNYEGREMLCGLQGKDVWQAGDRKELFLFYSKNIFQFFMYCDAILSMSHIFVNAADHYINNLPDDF